VIAEIDRQRERDLVRQTNRKKKYSETDRQRDKKYSGRGRRRERDIVNRQDKEICELQKKEEQM
jgi:hypothetical protein